MRLIKIEAETSGGHAYQTIDSISTIPDGWAVVPDDMETPNMPYGDITVEKIDGVMAVTSWEARENPEPVIESKPNADEVLNALLGVIE